MKQAVVSRIVIFGLTITTLFLTGCGISPLARFYTLTSVEVQEHAKQTVNNEKNIVAAIGPVEIPDYLDRQEIVLRAEKNQLVISEFDLWGGALKTDVNRVLVENISSFLAGDGMTVVTWKSAPSKVRRVPVVINRFEGSLNNNIILKAHWTVLDKEGKAAECFRETNIALPAKGGSYNSVVGAMSEALGELSTEIAASIRSIMTNQSKEWIKH